MLKWNKNCYIGKKVRNVKQIQEKLENSRIVPGIYLLTLSENPHNLMEILPAVSLIQRTAADLCPEIIGIASGREEALELVEEIVSTIYKDTGDVQLKEYLKNR
mgnify:CR=1 FL=1